MKLLDEKKNDCNLAMPMKDLSPRPKTCESKRWKRTYTAKAENERLMEEEKKTKQRRMKVRHFIFLRSCYENGCSRQKVGTLLDALSAAAEPDNNARCPEGALG